mgnify:FL=1
MPFAATLLPASTSPDTSFNVSANADTPDSDAKNADAGGFKTLERNVNSLSDEMAALAEYTAAASAVDAKGDWERAEMPNIMNP